MGPASIAPFVGNGLALPRSLDPTPVFRYKLNVLLSSDQNPELHFEELNLSGPLLEAIQNAGYATATPIQARAMPLLLAGRDVLGQAQTGTGKTAAFAIPMLQRIDLEQKVPQVLVLTPTRELAIQVAEAFKRYAAGLPGLRVAPIYGGQDYHIQFRQLDRGVHVVVGTPGRVMDHMNRGSLKLDGLRGLVLDEADEMLQMGFADDVEWVLTRAPAQRQIALFSATIPESIRRIAQRHLRNPAEITIKQRPPRRTRCGNASWSSIRIRNETCSPAFWKPNRSTRSWSSSIPRARPNRSPTTFPARGTGPRR